MSASPTISPGLQTSSYHLFSLTTLGPNCVCSGLPRSRSQDRIRRSKDLLDEIAMKDRGRWKRSRQGEPSDPNAGQTAVNRHREERIG